MLRDFLLPDLGEGVHEGQIVRVIVKEGDSVREDDPLMEVETDKASVEIPSPVGGTVSKIHVRAAQVVNVGDVLVTFAVSDEAAARKPASRPGGAAPAPAPRPVPAAARGPQAPHPAPAAPRQDHKPASPAVRRLARELGLDLATIQGSGPGGRVSREDVERAAASAGAAPRGSSAPAEAPPLPPPPAPMVEPAGTDDTDPYGPIRRQLLSQARKTVARVMSQAWASIPHVTDCHDADVTELDRLRRGYAAPDQPQRKLTLLAFVVRAVVRALQRFPEFNASYDETAGEVVYRRYVNVAVGVHTPRGLIAPVLCGTDRLSIPQIADELAAIAAKARSATFAVNDTRGGTYTISNPGALGGSRYSTPIITPPQVAVLGLGRARLEPRVLADGQIVPRLILPLSHSFDHRLIDGGQELQFMEHLIGDLENPARLLL